ncbi:putative dna helicase recq, partial [Morchella snyderi]
YDAWEEGKKKVMVASTALGAGIDIQSIRLVIYLKSPFQLMDLVQGTGRAGSDGKRAVSICMPANNDI